MGNQIQLYHDLTLAWLDKEWKTPREKKLEVENQKLRAELDSRKAELNSLKAELEPLRPLKVFLGIPCKVCGKPMSNDWSREQVLKAFDGWGHRSCF